jgi:hypothetical protein
MKPKKAWDEMRDRRTAGLLQMNFSAFIRAELPNARKTVDAIIRSRQPISINSSSARLLDLIKSKNTAGRR